MKIMRDVLVIDCKGQENFWRTLKSNNKILFAATVNEGLNLLSENVGLLFLNIKHLESSEIEVLRLIKKAYPLIEAVIITTCGTEKTCTDALRKGARNCINKPLNADEIIQKIKTRIRAENASQKPQQSLLPTETHEDEYFPDVPSHLANGVLKVRDYIIQNYEESITLDDACKMASTSKTYFCRFFKCATGHSLRNYHHLVKVHRAEELLRDKRLSIADVAIKLGYNDSNYFSTIYKKFKGQSPKYSRADFRKLEYIEKSK
jgi:YesN/AraC family two-component response regulator